MVGGRYLLKVVAVIPFKGQLVEREVSRRECEDETELWIAIVEFGNDRLCDMADAREAGMMR